jgi:hypothetical protein
LGTSLANVFWKLRKVRKNQKISKITHTLNEDNINNVCTTLPKSKQLACPSFNAFKTWTKEQEVEARDMFYVN